MVHLEPQGWYIEVQGPVMETFLGATGGAFEKERRGRPKGPLTSFLLDPLARFLLETRVVLGLL